jgi:hypothetical protein
VVSLTGTGVEGAGLDGVRAVKSPPAPTTIAHGVLVGWSAARAEHRGRTWKSAGRARRLNAVDPVGGSRRRALAPQLVDQMIDRDRFAAVKHQHSQQRSLLYSAQHIRLAVLHDPQRPKYPEFHDSSLAAPGIATLPPDLKAASTKRCGRSFRAIAQGKADGQSGWCAPGAGCSRLAEINCGASTVPWLPRWSRIVK